jgi:hypothetical protein
LSVNLPHVLTSSVIPSVHEHRVDGIPIAQKRFALIERDSLLMVVGGGMRMWVLFQWWVGDRQ